MRTAPGLYDAALSETATQLDSWGCGPVLTPAVALSRGRSASRSRPLVGRPAGFMAAGAQRSSHAGRSHPKH